MELHSAARRLRRKPDRRGGYCKTPPHRHAGRIATSFAPRHTLIAWRGTSCAETGPRPTAARSTSGAVDDTALFYLRSRGLESEEAEELLVLAFVDEAISEIENEAFADQIRERLAAWLLRHRA